MSMSDTVLHDDPKDIAAHGFKAPYRTMEFDFLLKTHAGPDSIASEERTG
ncbi:hypothetical protein OG819_29485 [Streptomyces sp. NBC_01549]|nr:hypothetical protein [Streptomyces sp. NBC_01719]MCX4593737.1 hypothetical protein [Streptomyces sp. NBC_01549]